MTTTETRRIFRNYELADRIGQEVGTFTVTEKCELTDISFMTASWYDHHEVQPGVYPISVGSDKNLYIEVDTILLASYREDRLFSKVYGNLQKPNAISTYTLRLRPYQVLSTIERNEGKDFGGTLSIHSDVTISETELPPLPIVS